MSSPSFRLQRFEVFHDRCAMKVGMDGITLGAWAEAPEPSAGERLRILDIGTGSGLVALMLAQKYPQALIDAVEKDVDAALQAAENVARSPWPDTVSVYQGRFPEELQKLEFETRGAYHLIVCNPPFYKGELKPSNRARCMARHSDDLPLALLAKECAPLLRSDGRLTVILPYEAAELFEEYCYEYRLYVIRRCALRSVENKAPKRALITVSPSRTESSWESLTVAGKDGTYTPDYRRLTQDYYL